MNTSKDRLCLVTPDTFYGALLQNAKFITYEAKVVRGSDQFSSLAVNFFPDAFLLFSSHLGPAVLARMIIELRFKFPNAHLFQIEGFDNPLVSLVWSPIDTGMSCADKLAGNSVELIDLALRSLSQPNLPDSVGIPRLTRSQLDVVQGLACGMSNYELAEKRQTTLRAIEGIMKRALSRIGAAEGLSSRAKVVLAQKYLALLDKN